MPDSRPIAPNCWCGTPKRGCAACGSQLSETSAAGILRLLQLREAIASVSLSHPEKCECLTCRAGRGDEEAFAQIVADLEGKL